ncbi:MAG: indolepyruvate ferredoxin oxidoreductase subunit alpha [Zestosphaera tikiterensis]|uniref:Indolepyruvate oxidoreductase subunit IorA n=1 Tax=Zestosphaera tikiterensis TaxID=1973259 RepID=A0A2R7Y6M7_9CREN|nr:MAG: indolepyruvate ferredoxin oxidoreductase subunit alpha [Zestosphaera tikiterensis]
MSFSSLARLSGGRHFLLGNEAIARGALEAGLGVAAAYPGTPSSEIVESLMSVKDILGIYVEWSVNEKVAFETAYAAAIAGVKSLTAMKHVGLNVAADPFMSAAYTGVEESFVIVTADDPSMHSSQNEQDNRWFGVHAFVPVFEPYDATEAKDLTKAVFEFSSRFKHPVLLRTTTRVSHTRGYVDLGPIPEPKVKGKFNKEDRYVVVPANARRNKQRLLQKWKEISKAVNEFPFNSIQGDGKSLIVASGLAYGYVREAVKYLGVEDKVKILKLATTYPLPRDLLLKSVEDVENVLVVEELDPLVEKEVKSILYDEGVKIPVRGKDLVGMEFELTHYRVRKAIAEFMGVRLLSTDSTPLTVDVKLPPRPPTFCPGCPYRPFFFELRRFLTQEKLPYIISGDIGCYSLAYNPPYNLQDVTIEMGSSIGVGGGLSVVTEDVVIATIGDSTFYHAGLPPLVNAVWLRKPLITVVLDNEVTAMTGHQPAPSSRRDGNLQPILIEEVARGIGVKFVEVVDPFDIKKVREVLKKAVEYVKTNREPAVVVVRRRCALEVVRDLTRAGVKYVTFKVLEDKCIGCGICYDWFSCPAITSLSNRKASIDPELCVGCAACVQVCPTKAIVPSEEYDQEEVEKYWR